MSAAGAWSCAHPLDVDASGRERSPQLCNVGLVMTGPAVLGCQRCFHGRQVLGPCDRLPALTDQRIDRLADLPAQAEVEFLPFLGILVHRELVARIGLPDAGFFNGSGR